jgi:hypothetical protein
VPTQWVVVVPCWARRSVALLASEISATCAGRCRGARMTCQRSGASGQQLRRRPRGPDHGQREHGQRAQWRRRAHGRAARARPGRRRAHGQGVGVAQGGGAHAADRNAHPLVCLNFFGRRREGFICAEVGHGSFPAPGTAAIADAVGLTKWARRLRPAAPQLFGELNPAERRLPTVFFTRWA